MAERPIDLDTPVQFVRGVGPFRAEAFRSLGVETVGDLIEHLPHRYETIPRSVPIDRLILDETATVIGAVKSLRNGGGGVVAEVVDGTGRCRVRWFNADYVADRVGRGTVLRLTGKVDVYNDLAQFINPRFQVIEEGADPFASDAEQIEPVYPAVAQLPSPVIRRIIAGLIDQVTQGVTDPLPESLRRKRMLPPRATALARVHQPVRLEDVTPARRRLAYDELLLMQLAVQTARLRGRASLRGTPLPLTATIDERIRKRFPFPLTPGQDAAVAQIVADLAKPRPMNRLLQGDVGSGKTAVAMYAALVAIANRLQAAILAPTEILAEQHHRKALAYLQGSRVRIGILTGGTATARRAGSLRDAAEGKLDLVIGTHALLEKNVAFRDLGLLIIDEQHRFGVAQRAAARAKGISPHTLIMTATPIPRTLAMTYFGDLDITTIRDAPPGRRPIETRLLNSGQLKAAWSFVRDRLSQGRQAYIVYPLVEDSEALPLKAAQSEFERLRAGPLAGFNIGLVHGRMPAAEKDRVMAAFRDGSIHALVSTTVIEVGVDVPNAAVMVIEHAERYGLSQLHQLRGRIGRGDAASNCLLICDARNPGAMERLNLLCRTTDGFQIAEEDLRLRGPGELLGTRQHGLPKLRAANLLEDTDLLDAAREDAAEMIATDPSLRDPSRRALRDALHRRYGESAALIAAG